MDIFLAAAAVPDRFFLAFLAQTRSGKEHSCYVVPSHQAFDLDALNNRDVAPEEDVTIEPEDFIIGEVEAGAESEDETQERPPGTIPSTQNPVPEELTDGSSENDAKSPAALQRNRDKKRKRRERQDPTGEEAARRRVLFLARATLLKSKAYGVQSGRHSKSGYVGIVDRGLDFAFLAGPATRRIRRLLQHGYELLEFDKLPCVFFLLYATC